MKVVLDTNVLISGICFTGPPFQVLEAWKDGTLRLCISLEIFEEYGSVADRLAVTFPTVDLHSFIALVAAEAEVCAAPPLPVPVCDDPTDDKFLACAVACGACTIVSGDRHLLKVSGYQDIEVLRPRAFLERYL